MNWQTSFRCVPNRAEISSEIVMRDTFGWSETCCADVPAYNGKVYFFYMVSYVPPLFHVISGCNVIKALNGVSWVMSGFLGFGKGSYFFIMIRNI